MAAPDSMTLVAADFVQRPPSAADRCGRMDEKARAPRCPHGSTAPGRLLDELLDELADRAPGRTELAIELGHGRTLDVREGEGGPTLCVRRPDGAAEVTIELRPTGPVVRVEAAALEVAHRGQISIECESFAVRAQRRIDLACERGDVRLDAGDDVVATGERIRLN